MKKQLDYDVVVIGAGISGMYQVYKLRKKGFSVQGIEADSGVGGAWQTNRYPGCRVDSESHTYSYFWSKKLLAEFNWTERFAGQPEVLKYLNFAADHMDIRKNYMFNTRVKGATYNEEEHYWTIELLEGGSAPMTARYLITATGPLSAPQMPNIEGIHTYTGEWHHTARWPRDPNGYGGGDVDFTGKRVGVIGTGSTGVQMVQEVSKTAAELFVFQRSPNWCTPLGNAPLSQEEMDKIKENYDELDNFCNTTLSGFPHIWLDKDAGDVSDEERNATLERLYKGPGFSMWLGNYRDILENQKANDYVSEFVANKIRQRINDPVLAEKMIPKDHGYGTRRVPLETRYYECYNQDNVTLVDLNEAPIDRITPNGIKTTAQEYDLDMIVYASGFDAIVGSVNRINIVGKKERKLKDAWSSDLHSYLGIQFRDFPNYFNLVGPQNGTTFCNIPRCSATQVEWLADFLTNVRDSGKTVIEASEKAQNKWTEECRELMNESLLGTTKSWFTGVNNNIPGRDKPSVLLYAGGNPAFKILSAEIAANAYEGFEIS